MNYFLIDAQLPSLNEYTRACRSHWSKGAEYKKSVESFIGYSINAAVKKGTLHPVDKPVEIYIYWHERTRRRDVDNIQSAQKFILDALQSYKIIKNDSRRYVRQIRHEVIDDKKDFAIIEMREV